jgi:hypothetical protein
LPPICRINASVHSPKLRRAGCRDAVLVGDEVGLDAEVGRVRGWDVAPRSSAPENQKAPPFLAV